MYILVETCEVRPTTQAVAHSIFTALILSRITYALSVWDGHITNHQRQWVNAFLKRARKYKFTEELYSIEEDLLEKADAKLFGRILYFWATLLGA